MRFKSLIASMVLVLGLASSGRAADILSNLPGGNTFAATIQAGSPTFRSAVAFTMGAEDYTLDTLVLFLGGFDPTDTPQIEIRNDTGGLNPGTSVLASFTNPAGQGTSAANYTFTPSVPFTLSAQTKYWLLVASSSGVFTWDGNNTTPKGVATANGQRTNVNTTWFDTGDYSSFQITGTVVPEPSTYILGGLATGVMAFVARRRKAKRQG